MSLAKLHQTNTYVQSESSHQSKHKTSACAVSPQQTYAFLNSSWLPLKWHLTFCQSPKCSWEFKTFLSWQAFSRKTGKKWTQRSARSLKWAKILTVTLLPAQNKGAYIAVMLRALRMLLGKVMISAVLSKKSPAPYCKLKLCHPLERQQCNAAGSKELIWRAKQKSRCVLLKHLHEDITQQNKLLHSARKHM